MQGERDLGPYRLVRLIGKGGMGVVYEAWDPRLERRVAIKMVHPHLLHNKAVLAKFEREARNAAKIEHPNVVRVYRIDRHDDELIIEMEYLDGVPLSMRFQEGPITPVDAAVILRQVLEALEACHKRGVIHCDLKPANLLITETGKVVLTDFGIARALLESGGDSPTTTIDGRVWGTPQYCPPEAWEGASVSPQWDLYAAGLLVYEGLSGQPAFRGPTTAAIIQRILEGNLPRLGERSPDISARFETLIQFLVSPEPEDRPASARAALAALAETPESALPTAVTERVVSRPGKASRKSNPRKRTLAVTLPLLAAVCAIVGGGLLLQNRTGRHSATLETSDSAISNSLPPQAPTNFRNFVVEKLAVSDHCAFFSADDGVHGREPWRADIDGSSRMVADVNPGRDGSYPKYFTPVGGGALFAGKTLANGQEPWFANGDGARLIKDIIPGTMSSEPMPLVEANGLVLLYATTLANGREPWSTNTLENQTGLVKDLMPGSAGSMPTSVKVTRDGDGALLVGLDGARGSVLFRYDFKTNEIHELADVDEDLGYIARIGSQLVMLGSNELHGKELWRYDEDSKTFEMIADLRTGPESSHPSGLFFHNGLVYFQADVPGYGKELCVTDGTTQGTHLVCDINPGDASGDPYNFTSVGNLLYFVATDAETGQEPWVSDGTEKGSRRCADLNPGPASSRAYALMGRYPYLFFTADDGTHGEELWSLEIVNGEPLVQMLADLYPGQAGSAPSKVQWTATGHGFFIANTLEFGQTLCRLDPGPELQAIARKDVAETALVPYALGAPIASATQ